jgi:hypothetical protein
MVSTVLVSRFMSIMGLFGVVNHNEVDPVNYRVMSNYKTNPVANAIYSRVSGVCATSRHVNCAILEEIQCIQLHLHNGSVQFDFQYDSRECILNRIKACDTRCVYMPMGLKWQEPTNTCHHLMLLVVDTIHHTYSVFDPNRGNMIIQSAPPHSSSTQQMNRYDMFLLNSNGRQDFLPGYRYIDQRQEEGSLSLQAVVDTTDDSQKQEYDLFIQDVPSGLCAVLSLLVLVCCFRFQSTNPWGLANSIKHVFMAMNDAEKKAFRVNLTNWYMNIYRAKSWRGVAELMCVCNVIPSGGYTCGVLLGSDGRQCTNPTCPRNVLCEKHYYRMVLQSLEHRAHFTCYITDDVLELHGNFI